MVKCRFTDLLHSFAEVKLMQRQEATIYSSERIIFMMTLRKNIIGKSVYYPIIFLREGEKLKKSNSLLESQQSIEHVLFSCDSRHLRIF